jgi:hypothetical protein
LTFLDASFHPHFLHAIVKGLAVGLASGTRQVGSVRVDPVEAADEVLSLEIHLGYSLSVALLWVGGRLPFAVERALEDKILF